jgi:hypothetical protein
METDARRVLLLWALEKALGIMSWKYDGPSSRWALQETLAKGLASQKAQSSLGQANKRIHVSFVWWKYNNQWSELRTDDILFSLAISLVLLKSHYIAHVPSTGNDFSTAQLSRLTMLSSNIPCQSL